MNLKRTLFLGVGGGAVVIWIANAAMSMSRSPVEITTRSTPHVVDASGAKLAFEISRLHQRLRPTAVPLQTRNLFSYASRQIAAASAAPPSTVTASIAAPPAAVAPLKLVGIAEDSSTQGVVRTAILSGFGDLFFGKEGETVGSRFRVTKVSSTGVELVDISNQSPLRLTLP